MNDSKALQTLTSLLATIILSFLGVIAPQLACTAEPDPTEPETPWPHEVANDSVSLLIHQPQVESWDGSMLRVRAAVAAAAPKGAAPTYGIIELQARTLVDKQQR